MTSRPPNPRNSAGRTLLEGSLAVVAIALATALIVGLASSALADNYPPEPWGYGTPAEDCVVCHSLEKGGPFRSAPNLWGIVGDEKARDREWFAYSPALIRVGGTWTEQDLDRFLEDASAFAPGSTKSIRVKDAERRQEIIAFLADLED